MSGRPMDGFPEGIFRSNWTEMWGHSHSGQCQIGNAKPRCAEFQLNAIECLEAYGAHRGRAHCQNFLDDYVECLHGFNQLQRVTEMKKERVKQVMRGERSVNNFYDRVKPPRDSLQFGPFHP